MQEERSAPCPRRPSSPSATARGTSKIQALEVVKVHLGIAGDRVRRSLRGMSLTERERRGWQGASWKRRVSDHARVQRALSVLIAMAARSQWSDPPPVEGSERERVTHAGRATDHYPPAQVRGRTAAEEAQLGMSSAAGPGGENGSQDPRRFPPTFHGGRWSCCLINPTSMGAYIADIKTLPADFLFLQEASQ